MSDPYIGEIRMFGGSFAPEGWAFCEGQPLPIAEYDTLFQLIGTTFGGDGQQTFGLPDLRGRSPLHAGNLSGTTYTIGEAAGEEAVTLSTAQLPAHTHPMLGSVQVGGSSSATDNVLASLPAGAKFAYGNVGPFKPLDPSSIAPNGGSQPHDNRQPFLAVSFILSLFGVFPPPN
jgi:microcystin-dependent protein